MATIRFYLRGKTAKSKIQMQFSFSRELRIRTAIDLVINHTDWSGEKNFPKQNNPENKNISRQLRELSNFLLNEYNGDFEKGVIFDHSWLSAKLDIHFKRIDEKEDESIFLVYLRNFIDSKQSVSSYTDCTVGKFKNLYDRFAAYQKKKKKAYIIQDINSKTVIEFKHYLVMECDLMETTATRFIKNLKTVLFDARNNGILISHQITGLSVGTTNTEYKVFLSFDEIDKIKSIQTLDKDWILAKDWLVIGCFLGQRVSDLFRMNDKMIYTKTDSAGNSFRFIEMKQQKTSEKVVIPLHYEVENILRKYNGSFPPVFTQRPSSNAVLFNRHIKKVCELAGIHEMITGKVYNESKKKNEIVETEKCNLVSSHVCRRSFATNFYGNKKFSTPELMSITGHKTESMFLNYIGKTADDWAMQTAKTFSELSNMHNAVQIQN